MVKKYFEWIILSIVLVVILLAIIFAFNGFSGGGDAEQDIFAVNLREHKNLALHIHPVLEIEILGKPYPIPANVGISPQGMMRVIHTHDATGKLHIESPYPHQFYLKDFFRIWEKNFNSSCIFDYCEDSTHQFLLYVDGVQGSGREGIPLLDGEVIRIVYKER